MSSAPDFCFGCEHKTANKDPELHCYMFKVPPPDFCAQHSAFKALRQDFGKTFLEVFTCGPQL